MNPTKVCEEELLALSEKVENVKSPRIMNMNEFSGIVGLAVTVKEVQEKYGLSISELDKAIQEKCAEIDIGDQQFILEGKIVEYLDEQEERKRRREIYAGRKCKNTSRCNQ